MISDAILNCIENDLDEIARREQRIFSFVTRLPGITAKISTPPCSHSELKRKFERFIKQRRLTFPAHRIETRWPRCMLNPIGGFLNHNQVTGR